MYLKNAYEIFNNDPVIVVELILPQFQSFVSSDLVDGCSMYEHETHHVIGGVPSCYNVMRSLRPSSEQVQCQAGRAIVVELMIAKESCCTW